MTETETTAKAPSKSKTMRKVKASTKSAPGRAGSKTAKILELLKRPMGASLKELMKATDWQRHSVHGFLSGTIKTKMDLKIESFERKDRERAYRLPK